MYAVAEDEIAVHLYGASNARFEVGGAKITLSQTTRYPWDGAIRLDLTIDKPARFVLSLRIPGWADGASIKVNGETVDIDAVAIDGYARIEREWKSQDHVDLDLPLQPRALFANPRVRQDAGRTALMRGPLVYCVEATDNGEGLNGIELSDGVSHAKATELTDMRGAIALDVKVMRDEADWGGTLYRTRPPKAREATARFVPYPFWDNRAPGEMLVWVRTAKVGEE
jgi:DUF1680 family protein